MDLEGITLSEILQRETPYDFTYMQKLQNNINGPTRRENELKFVTRSIVKVSVLMFTQRCTGTLADSLRGILLIFP